MSLPVRTCIGCGAKRPQSAMFRLARRSDGQLIPAPRSPQGRTAYLCPSRLCLSQLASRKAERAWKRRVTFEPEPLWNDLSTWLIREHAHLQRSANRGAGCRLKQVASLLHTYSDDPGTATPTRGS